MSVSPPFSCYSVTQNGLEMSWTPVTFSLSLYIHIYCVLNPSLSFPVFVSHMLGPDVNALCDNRHCQLPECYWVEGLE
jgi:hypothetical protein